MKVRTGWLFGFVAIAVACAVVVASGGPQPARSDQQPFRSRAELVEVDAVVHDKSGRFVPDLTAADFEVLDDGRPAQVDLVTLVRGAAAPASLASSSPVSAANQPDSAVSKARHRVFIAFFDDDHLTPGGFKRVQAAAQTLFAKAFQAGDIGGVVTRGQMVNKRLTSDRDELLKAVASARPSGKTGSRLADERDWPRMSEAEAIRYKVNNDDLAYKAVHDRACTDEPDVCKRIDIQPIILEKATQMAQTARLDSERTVSILATLLNGLAGFQGRKTVLLMTEGFMAEESWPFVQQAVTLAARADARIYTLDGRALDRGGLSDRLAGADPGNFQAYATILSQMDTLGDAMNTLATDTGGFVVRNTNFFDKAVAQIADESGTYYLLGFRPAANDGKFHKLTVRVRRPGVTVRARRGYIATVVAVPTIEELAQSIAAAGLPGRIGIENAPAATPSPSVSADRAPSAPAASVATPGAVTGVAARLRPDAVKHAATLAGTAPTDRDATAGWEAYQRGDLEAAQSSLKKAVSQPGSRPWVSYALGQSDYALRSYQDAAQAWESVRDAAPEFEPVYFDLVDAYLQLKDYDRASRVLRDAVKRWPNDAEVYEAAGVVHVARNVLDDAVKSFEDAVAKAPSDGVGYFNLARALELRYRESRRWIAQTQTWHANEHDRDAAIENYKRYLEIGGTFEAAARDALSRLEWKIK